MILNKNNYPLVLLLAVGSVLVLMGAVLRVDWYFSMGIILLTYIFLPSLKGAFIWFVIIFILLSVATTFAHIDSRILGFTILGVSALILERAILEIEYPYIANDKYLIVLKNLLTRGYFLKLFIIYFICIRNSTDLL